MTLWSKQLGEQCWTHLVYGVVETEFINSKICVVKHFDQLILDYCTPLVCVCIFNEESHKRERPQRGRFCA